LPDLTDLEQQLLDKVWAGYYNLVSSPPLLEKALQVAVLDPLLPDRQ